MVMEPAEVMGLASVMLDFLATTVQVNLQKPFKIETGFSYWFFLKLYNDV